MSNMELGQVFTRRILADYMVSLFTLPAKSTVLDPCFGGGVFLDSASENTDYSLYGYEIDSNLFATYEKKTSGALLRNTDFLLSNAGMKYDGVIMNPPYIRHEKIDDMKRYGITKARLAKKAIYSKLPGTANLYMYFVVKAISVLKANGELIVIFPESWLNSRGGATFKSILSGCCSVEKRIHVSGRAFEKDALVDVIILKLKKNATPKDCDTVYINIDANGIRSREMEQFRQASGSKVPFTAYAATRRGLTTGCNKIFVNPNISAIDQNIIEIISSPKAIGGFSTGNAAVDKLLAISKDSEISGELSLYLKRWQKHIAETGKPKTLAGKIGRGEKWYLLNRFDCRGIIFGYIVRSDMRFILNDSRAMVRDNFYVIYPSIDVFVMLALLNNYYVYAQLEAIGRKHGGGMLKLQKYDLESLMLTSLSTVSEYDKGRLLALGRGLAETGNRKIIDDITALLSAYEPLSADSVKFQYEYMRAKRLENAK